MSKMEDLPEAEQNYIMDFQLVQALKEVQRWIEVCYGLRQRQLHTHMHIYNQTRTHTHTHTHKHTQKHTHTHRHTCTPACTHTDTHTHTYTHTEIFSGKHATISHCWLVHPSVRSLVHHAVQTPKGNFSCVTAPANLYATVSDVYVFLATAPIGDEVL